MYREFGEQDQQASVMKKKTTGFGQTQVHSSLDHEMTDTSPIKDMSHLQSQMHFDESIEIVAADSDLEDGKIQNFSPKLNERRNQTWCNVFGNPNVSNLSETLFETIKDHLLNRARTDLARREIHVESLKSASMIY